MPSICFYFQVHQPFRLRKYTIFDQNNDYFDEAKNIEICERVARKCYLPSNLLMLKLIRQFEGQFRIAYSVTGTLLEQLEMYAPGVLSSFQKLAETGCVEFLSETYHHSLSFLYSRDEFVEQIRLHGELIYKFFGQRPRIFRNTELIYNNELAAAVEQIGGFDAIIVEGADHILGYRSPDFLYRPPNAPGLKLLLKNYRLSDDIAFRFSNRHWSEWPVTAERFSSWVNAINGNGYVVNLFMDYETLGEHQWEDTGIFGFMERLPSEILKHPDNDFKTPSEVVAAYDPVGEFDVPYTISWADIERDLSAWRGNPMQENALYRLYALADRVRAANDPGITADWRRLQTSDHFYYMCTKYFADGDVHKYFNHYDSPYEAYINFVTVLDNLESRCNKAIMQEQQASEIKDLKSEAKSHEPEYRSLKTNV